MLGQRPAGARCADGRPLTHPFWGSEKPRAAGNVGSAPPTAGRDRPASRPTGHTVRRPGPAAPADERRENVGGTDRRRRRPTEVLLLRQVAEAGQEAHRRPRGLHLRRVHRPLQRDHRRGAGRVRRGEVGRASQADGDLPVPRPVRRGAGAGQEGAVGRGLQPLQADPGGGRRTRAPATRWSWPSPTSC